MSKYTGTTDYKEPQYFLSAPERLLSHLSDSPKGVGIRLFERQLSLIEPNDISSLIENRNELANIKDRFFEELIADLLKADGFEEIELISRVNAPGPDIIAYNSNPTGGKQQFIVECKRWKNKVGIEVVRSLMYRVDTEYRATGGILVSTADFTKDVRDEARKLHMWRLTLKDGRDVLEWLKKHAGSISEKWVNRLDPFSHSEGKEVATLLRDHKEPKLAVSDSICQRCGGTVLCCYLSLHDPYNSDISWWHDHYFHVCIECLNINHTIKYEHDMLFRAPGYSSEAPEECPFCFRDWSWALQNSQ